MTDNQKIASEYRRETGRAGGVVVLYNSAVSGWVNELRDPQHWRPGCVAVDDVGQQYIAVGGNSSDGAEEWAAVN